jgi:hypothetical protein
MITLGAKDAGLVAVGAAGAGLASAAIVKWAQSPTSSGGTTKVNSSTITLYPYMIGFGIAIVGLLLALPTLVSKNPWLASVGIGLFAGGLAEGTAEIVQQYFNW